MFVLRHKKFPLRIIYDDPKENWDKIVEERVLKEIQDKGFDRFVIEDEKKSKI